MPVASVDPMASRMRRTFPAVGAALLALALVTGCAPEPAPTPTPTGFASDDEAFAAAEATYRAYVDAGNAVRADPEATPLPTDFLTGAALDAELASVQRFEDAGVSLVGDLAVKSIRQLAASTTSAEIGVCLDASQTRVINTSGEDVTPADRSNDLGVKIETVWSSGKTFISSTTSSDDQC